MPRTLATADIGSNTVHLLVAETNGLYVRRLVNQSEWLALGESVARLRRITETQIIQLITILDEFQSISRTHGASLLEVFATEAMRAAENHDEVVNRIRRKLGLKVTLITPRQEAEWSLRGTMLDTDLGSEGLLFEVGGGSAQIAVLSNGEVVEELSLPLGTGRIVVEAGLTNPSPAEAVQAARRYIRDRLREWKVKKKGLRTVASGGVARGLWRSLHPDGERSLAPEEIIYVGWAAARLNVALTATRFGCKLKRAATLLPGALVYEELMRHAGLDELMVSEFGVREGAVLTRSERV